MSKQDWPNTDRRETPHSCNPDTCQYHYLTESVISDLKESVVKLLEGQTKMSETIIQLTEAFKAIEKLDSKLEKLEDLQRTKDAEQDKKIDELRMFTYKAMGAIGVIVTAAGMALKFIGMG